MESLKIQCLNKDDAGKYPFTPKEILTINHNLGETSLFDNDKLVALLNNYPREDINVHSMAPGANLREATREWRAGSLGDLSGEEIIQAVMRGRIWLNIKRLDYHFSEYRTLTDQLYEHLAVILDSAPPRWKATTLLVSSPSATVHYHADPITNILWHIRGEKTAIVYPNLNPKFAPDLHLEAIIAGLRDEELPYDPSFEDSARVFELYPGQAILWPQNSPHRVLNTDGLNISLNTEHITPQVRQKVGVYRANRLLRKIGLSPGTQLNNLTITRAKQLLSLMESVAKKLRRKAPISYEFTPTFVLDPRSENGISEIR